MLIKHRASSTLKRNDLEMASLAICRAVGLPPAAVNVWIPFPDGGGAEADFHSREQRLIVGSTAATSTPLAARFTQTAGATSASCCSAGGSCGSPGVR